MCPRSAAKLLAELVTKPLVPKLDKIQIKTVPAKIIVPAFLINPLPLSHVPCQIISRREDGSAEVQLQKLSFLLP